MSQLQLNSLEKVFVPPKKTMKKSHTRQIHFLNMIPINMKNREKNPFNILFLTFSSQKGRK